MKRLLLTLPLLLASYALIGPSAPVLPADAQGATFTASQTPGQAYTTLTYLPGKTATLNTVAHLMGPALRVNDSRCIPEPTGILCVLGAVPAPEKRVIYVTGYASSVIRANRENGSLVEISGR